MYQFLKSPPAVASKATGSDARMSSLGDSGFSTYKSLSISQATKASAERKIILNGLKNLFMFFFLEIKFK